jgi:prepilin-type processing-associated H-X9-DG protein
MAVIMTAEVAGADASFMDGMRAAGVLDAMASAPGFVSHVSGASATGYRVIEVWDSRDAHRAWFDGHVAPNLPPEADRPEWEYIDVVITVPER